MSLNCWSAPSPRTPTRHGCLTTLKPLEVLAWPDDLRQALERGLFCPLELDDREAQREEALLEEMPGGTAAPKHATGPGQPMSQQDLDSEEGRLSLLLWAMKRHQGELRMFGGIWKKHSSGEIPNSPPEPPEWSPSPQPVPGWRQRPFFPGTGLAAWPTFLRARAPALATSSDGRQDRCSLKALCSSSFFRIAWSIWGWQSWNASSSASMDRISCRMSTRLLSGTTSAMVISSAVSVFGGALPRCLCPGTTGASGTQASPFPLLDPGWLALHNEQVVGDAVRLIGSRGCLEGDELLAWADPALLGCLWPPRAACLAHELVI